MSLSLTGAHVVVSLDPPAVVQADIHLEGGRVTAVGSAAPFGAVSSSIDCSGCLVIPGNVCAHTHVYSALARGMPYRLAAPTNFTEILQRIWWRLDRALDSASVRASALVAGREALLAGTTTLVDHHASPNAIDGSLGIVAHALDELGIRSVLCYEVTDRDGPERALAGLDENRRFRRAVHDGRYPLAGAMVGAHASFTLLPDTLAACAGLARESDAGLHIHVAEDLVDETDSVRRYGQRVVHRLVGAGALSRTTLIAHAIHLDESEAEIIRASGATIAHNPRSNMNNSVGRAPIALLGPRVALGTDGVGADMFEESRLAWMRRREEDGATPSDWPLARMAEGHRLAGRALGEPLLGRIEVGAPADLVVLDYAAPTLVTSDNLAGHWIYGLSSAAVRDVVVAGEPVVRDRRLTKADERELVASARQEAARLWERLETIGPHPFAPRVDEEDPIGALSHG